VQFTLLLFQTLSSSICWHAPGWLREYKGNQGLWKQVTMVTAGSYGNLTLQGCAWKQFTTEGIIDCFEFFYQIYLKRTNLTIPFIRLVDRSSLGQALETVRILSLLEIQAIGCSKSIQAKGRTMTHWSCISEV